MAKKIQLDFLFWEVWGYYLFVIFFITKEIKNKCTYTYVLVYILYTHMYIFIDRLTHI